MGGSQLSAPRTVGERFAEVRERLGLSRSELAFAIGYSAEQIRKVELGERMPGGELLAALLDAGGDVVYVLSGSSGIEKRFDESSALPTADEMSQARLREQIRIEARQYARTRADRRKKVLSDEEADLIDNFRELSSEQRREALAMTQALKSGLKIGGGKVVIGYGGRTAGRDINIGRTKKKT